MMNHLEESVYQLQQMIRDKSDRIKVIGDEIADTFLRGNRVFLAGNGGSAADAQHIAAEFVVRYRRDRRALPAYALTSNGAVMTAAANDLSYEQVFSRQLEALAQPSDLLWVFSTSGKSQSVTRAVWKARGMGLRVVLFTGDNDCEMARWANHTLAVGSTTAVSQQLHMAAAHAICEQIEERALWPTGQPKSI